jgi:hypothetical protein
MARYETDPRLREFKAKVASEIQRVATHAEGGGFVIYAIRDPTLKDGRRMHPDGPPIYVGQTKQFSVRADDHMRDGGKGKSSTRCKAGRLKKILDQWQVPKFEILDTAPTHLTSLIAETVWARRFVWFGYELANRWPEHQTREAPRGLESVPLKRLGNLTVAEALVDEVGVQVGCAKCGTLQALDLETLRPEITLKLIKSLQATCPTCRGPYISFVRPDPLVWKWQSYQPRAMPPRDPMF